MQAVVFGNITLDVLCKPVDDVPRHESLSFDQVIISPGGCGSNVAIGLSTLGIETALIGCIGSDDAAFLVQKYWSRSALNTQYVRRIESYSTGTSVGLVDSDSQPRFIHTSGANQFLTQKDISIASLIGDGAKSLHIAGYFVLPGVLDGSLGHVLKEARHSGLLTTLDVVRSPRMSDPSSLWSLLPQLDVFLCNQQEAFRITGEQHADRASKFLRKNGANAVIIKLGQEGCWLDSEDFQVHVPGLSAKIVDTTGAGDAFAAGFIAARLNEHSLPESCQHGNAAGARIVEKFGAVTGWFDKT